METILGTYKKGEFFCELCKKQHSYMGWEDTEISFDDFSVHLGCMKDHYKKLVFAGVEAMKNLKFTLERPDSISQIAQERLSKTFASLQQVLNDE